MTRYEDTLYYEDTSDPVAGVIITVFNQNTTTPAVLYDVTGAVTTELPVTDANGVFYFYADEGTYDLHSRYNTHYITVTLSGAVSTITSVPGMFYVPDDFATLEAARVSAGAANTT
jgi:hypothetical protein